MAETIEDVARRLAELEFIVAKGFHDAELRDSALSRKIDVNTESVRADLQSVTQHMAAIADEFRRTSDSIRQEHAADREVLRVALQQHARRLHDIEARHEP